MAFPAIQTKYIGPTDTKGARVKAATIGGRSVTIAWDDALDAKANHDAAAVALSKKVGFAGEMVAGDNGDVGYVYVFVLRTWEHGGSARADVLEMKAQGE